MGSEFQEEDLWDLINDGWDGMSREERHLWDAMKRPPELWTLRGYGQCWVAGLIGQTVLYYNHYEGGFETSSWSQYGRVDHYQSMQYTLGEAVQRQVDVIRTGYDIGPRFSPPINGELKASGSRESW